MVQKRLGQVIQLRKLVDWTPAEAANVRAGIECRLGDADLLVGGGGLALGFGDIGAAFQ